MVKGSTSQTVALVVQGKDGTNDWYYSKQITGTETINVSAIEAESNTPASINLSACKIWLEITEDNVSYAVNAEKEIEKINTTYVTKEQLMNSFKPYSNGTAVNYGKLVFGKKSDGTTAQEWYILGKDTGVSGDNTIIVAASPIARGQKFNSDISNKNDENLWSDCVYSEATITEVYANHYGASELRDTLQGMATNTSYFTSAEQGLMNATTVTTKDTKNSTGTETINASDIKSALSLTSDIDLSACKIWLETTDSTSNLTYAVNATDIISITSVAITDIDIPVSNTALDTEASCTTEGVKSTTPQITWTPSDTTAGYNTRYTASITLTAATGYEFADNVTATVSGNTATSVTKNAADDTLTVTKEFTTDKRKIESVAAPTVPENNTFTAYYGYDGYDTTPISGTNTELGKTATVTFEGTTSPTTEDMAVTWTIESDGGVYDKTPEAENIFRWTIPESALTNYNAANCQGYDTSTGNITGTITVKNKAATPVAITGTDSSITYTGETVDVSQYFSIDNNAGAATYTLVTGTNGGTGKGTLSGTTLTVTQTGTFKIKVSTVANGIFAAGEKTVTLTVDNGTILYTATDYSTTYDGQPHSISVSVTNPEGAAVTYSTDGITYGSDNPSFSNEGTYTVYYRITKDNYTTVEGSKTVTINKKPVTITAQEQDIVWGKDINQSLYTVSEDGLITGDSIKEITLTPSTTDRTENGTISVSGVKIENAAGVDVTANYDITMANGNLKITHNTALAPERIEASKTKTTYTAGDTLNVDDLAVTVYYADGYSEPVQDYTTNVFAIDMSADGDKILTVSYTKNGVTKTKDITIKVNAALASYKIISGADSEWKQNTDRTITIGGNGEFSKFESVKVDGSIIDAKNYTAKEGSTIIILKADYLKTLSVGTHSFEIVWADGSAVTSFKVSKNTSDNEGSKDNNGNKDNSNDNPNSNPAAVPDDKKTNGSNSENNTDDSQQITAPQTGDNSHLMLWVTLLAASLAGLLALLSVRMKKDDE